MREKKAFDAACKSMRDKGGFTDAEVALVRWQKDAGDRKDRPSATRTERRTAARTRWQDYAPAALLNSQDRWILRVDNYPHPSRILPTTLGNALRAREDKLPLNGKDLEGIVMRRYNSAPARLMVLALPPDGGHLVGEDVRYGKTASEVQC